MDAAKSTIQLHVWDLPTRIFHWLLAFCVMSLIVTGLIGNDALAWHLLLGYGAATLLFFRVVWGFIGGYWSRFKHFCYSPRIMIGYLRGQSQPAYEIGHNPLGSLSIWGLFLLLGVQIITGLMSDDEIATQGPLAKLASSAITKLATNYHTEWGKWLLIALITLHTAAIFFYYFKKKNNLLRPMLTGNKSINSNEKFPASNDNMAQRGMALAIFALIALAVAYAVRQLG